MLFKKIDKDGNGMISITDLKETLQKWYDKMSTEEVEEILNIADVDGNGLIDYNEFVASTMNISKLNQDELIKKAFAYFDKDGNGFISESELVSVLEKFNLKDDSKDLIQMVDRNNDGSIDYEEFSIMMRSHIKNE